MQIAWHESLKFGQMTLGKIIKTVATRCQILGLKCTKFNFGWGSAPDPTGGAYTALPQTPGGLLLRGGEGSGGGRDGKGKGSLGEGRGRDPPLHAPPNPYFWIHPWKAVHPFGPSTTTRKI